MFFWHGRSQYREPNIPLAPVKGGIDTHARV